MIIAFDLDGTISDPIVGTAASINYALSKLGLPPKKQTDIKAYIGPSLKDIFRDLLGQKDDQQIHTAIKYFRERYFKIGYQENVIYPGIKELLSELSQNGHKLYIATAKKTITARAIADLFEIATYFDDILGCGLKREKRELLNDIKNKENTQNMIMIGDRRHDMQAGKACHCFCIGVLWGYGTKEELMASGADITCAHPKELLKILMQKQSTIF
jgi:phosphoglycolate phosphatase